MINDTDNVIIRLAKCFYNASLSFAFTHEDLQELTWDKQEHFLNLTIVSSAVKKYPINPEFRRLFLKKLINLLEPHQEMHDDIYRFLCSSMNNGPHDVFYYSHYLINDNLEDTVIIKETKNIVVNGTTGLRTWEAAFMLTDWALSNKEIFNNKNVLELGAGVGFSGIAISKHCRTTSLILSDCHIDVLNTINDNIQINFPGFIKKSNGDLVLYQNENKTIGVMTLDWNYIKDIEIDSPDIIIGADIIYDPSILKPLCNVFQFFCQRNSHLKIFIASVIRNADTYNQFLEALNTSQLHYEEIKLTENNNLNWNKNINGCIIKISAIPL